MAVAVTMKGAAAPPPPGGPFSEVPATGDEMELEEGYECASEEAGRV